MINHDIIIVGGGCIGCSIGKHLVEKTDNDVAVVEKEIHLAEHQSGRNSGVLHPGFNYPQGSLKARFATEGTRRMKEYCRKHGVPLRNMGVVVVAQSDEEEYRLQDIREQAIANGVTTEFLETEDEIQRHEPHTAGQAGLYAPGAASVDSQKYVYTLAKEAERKGVDFYMGYEVQNISFNGEEHHMETSKGDIHGSYLVNAAGLYADHLAHQLDIGKDYQIVPFRGEYYEIVPEKRSLVNSMIYPTPDPELPFLGVHYTRRTDDRVIVGPNAVFAFGREAYRHTQVDPAELLETTRFGGFWKLLASKKMLGVAWDELNKSYRKSEFAAAAQQLIPVIEETDLVNSYSGNRAQIVDSKGTLVKDPLFEHGLKSMHVLNAVSPGLTSSLPFGEYIADEVINRFK